MLLLCLLCLQECLVHGTCLKRSTKTEKLFVVCLPWLEQEAPEPVWADHVCGAHLGTPGVRAAWEPSWSALKRSWMSPC